MSRITSDEQTRAPERARHCAYRLADSPTGFCTFRPEVEQEGPGLCGWHHVVRTTPTKDTLEEFETWRARLVRARICDRWTHFTAQELWDGFRGGARSARATGCGGGDCPHGPADPPLIPPVRPVEGPTSPDPAHRERVLAQAREILKAGEI